MRIVCLSDTHDRHRPPDNPRAGQVFEPIVVPDADVVVHAGDFTQHGTPMQTMRAGLWFSGLPHKHKLYIAGNHDFHFEKKRDDAVAHFPGCTYLHEKSIEIDG